MVRILIADDHEMVRCGIKQILAGEPDLVVAGEAGDPAEVFRVLRKNHFDVVLLDISLPGPDGLEVLHKIKERQPRLPVLILSAHSEEQFGLRVIQAGAAGFLNKSCSPEELIAAIRKVKEGGKYITPSLAEQLADSLQHGHDKPPHETLTDREYQVLCKFATGKTLSQIARELSLSVKTISTYRARILAKMNLKTTAELIHYAILHRLV